MEIISSKQDFEFWGGLCEIEEHYLEVSPKELVDYLLECGYQELPNEVEIKKDGNTYSVQCWEVLSRDRNEMKRFFKEIK